MNVKVSLLRKLVVKLGMVWQKNKNPFQLRLLHIRVKALLPFPQL